MGIVGRPTALMLVAALSLPVPVPAAGEESAPVTLNGRSALVRFRVCFRDRCSGPPRASGGRVRAGSAAYCRTKPGALSRTSAWNSRDPVATDRGDSSPPRTFAARFPTSDSSPVDMRSCIELMVRSLPEADRLIWSPEPCNSVASPFARILDAEEVCILRSGWASPQPRLWQLLR